MQINTFYISICTFAYICLAGYLDGKEKILNCVTTQIKNVLPSSRSVFSQIKEKLLDPT